MHTNIILYSSRELVENKKKKSHNLKTGLRQEIIPCVNGPILIYSDVSQQLVARTLYVPV